MNSQTTQERIQNFWSPKNTGEDSEFLIPQEHRRGFRISDPPNNTGDSEFLISQTTQGRIQKFWSPKQLRRFRISDPPNNTGEDSEFLIPQITQDRIQTFWSSKNTGEDPEFLIPQTTQEIQNFRSPKQYRKVFNISDNPNNLRETSYFSLWSQSSEKSQSLRLKSTHDSGAV